MIPAKADDESTIRLLLSVSQQESLTVYTDGFRAYEPLDEDDALTVNMSSMAMASTLMETFT